MEYYRISKKAFRFKPSGRTSRTIGRPVKTWKSGTGRRSDAKFEVFTEVKIRSGLDCDAVQ
jgi:hypothetical protein